MFLLSRASGIDREEFERIVKTEIDMLDIPDYNGLETKDEQDRSVRDVLKP